MRPAMKRRNHERMKARTGGFTHVLFSADSGRLRSVRENVRRADGYPRVRASARRRRRAVCRQADALSMSHRGEAYELRLQISRDVQRAARQPGQVLEAVF